MKVYLVVDVDLQSMQSENDIVGWQNALVRDLGIEPEGLVQIVDGKSMREAWEQVACEISYQFMVGGDYSDFCRYVETQVDDEEDLKENKEGQ